MSSISAIQSREALLRLAVDWSPSGLLIADEKGRIVLVNRSVSSRFGYDVDELIGQSVNVLLPLSNGVHRDDFFEQNPIDESERPIPIQRSSLGQHKDGTKSPIRWSLHPIETEQGKFILVNVSDAKERHASDSNQAVMERLMLVGQLSGGIAHEIRTPLSVIRNDVYFLQSLGDRLGLEATEAIQEISESLTKASRIVGELLDFTRPPITRPEPVRFSSILSAALKSYRLPTSVRLLTEKSLDDCVFLADSEHVERILINLLRNAVQAMREEGTIEIQCGSDHRTVWLEVNDDGPGISDDDRNRVFDPLFTTKPTGIGLGLAISLRYARCNDGDLTVCNRIAGGASFRLSLPRGFLSIESTDHEMR